MVSCCCGSMSPVFLQGVLLPCASDQLACSHGLIEFLCILMVLYLVLLLLNPKRLSLSVQDQQ